MHIFVNGQPIDIPTSCSIADLIEHLELNSGPVAVERNREIIPRIQHSSTHVEEGDVLEIVNFVGGG